MKCTKPWLAPLLTACGFQRLSAGCLLQKSAPIWRKTYRTDSETPCSSALPHDQSHDASSAAEHKHAELQNGRETPLRRLPGPAWQSTVYVSRPPGSLMSCQSDVSHAGWASCCAGIITQRPDPYPPFKLNKCDLFDALRGSACPSGTLSLSLNRSGIQLKLFWQLSL